MSFSGPFTITLPKNGRLSLTRGTSGPIEVVLHDFDCSLHTVVRTGGTNTLVYIPKFFLDGVSLPRLMNITLRPLDKAPPELTLVPTGNSFSFNADARKHKSVWYATIPNAWVRGMMQLGWSVVSVEAGGHRRFVVAKPNTQGVITVPLPNELGGRQRVTIRRAVTIGESLIDADGFDWGTTPFQGHRALEGEVVILFSTRSSTRINRVTSWAPTMWLLGAYLAEGDKTNACSIPNKSRVFLRRALDGFEALGLNATDLDLSIIYGRVTQKAACAYYAPLGFVPSVVSKSTADGKREHTHGAMLYVREAGALQELLTETAKTIDLLALPDEALTAFLCGYFDGDGSFSGSAEKGYVLRFTEGDESMQHRIIAALDKYFGGASCSEAHGFEYRRIVSGSEIIRLIDDDFFTNSLSRVRMFYAARGLLAERHAAEWAFAQTFPDEGLSKVKGMLYEFDSTAPISKSYEGVRARQASNDPSVHHPEEKRAQIHEVLGDLVDLEIYEAHAGEGGCTPAYQEHGEVTSRTHDDGDAAGLLAGLGPTLFDVIDLDPYGFVFDLISGGRGGGRIFQHLKPGGFLFVTCANPARVHRAGSKRPQAAHFPNGPDPFDADAVADWIRRQGILDGFEVTLVSQIDFPSVWRFAFRIEEL